MSRAVAINVAANTTLPGFRGPVYPDGTFEYVPIPEREPISEEVDVPTYADLDLEFEVPPEYADQLVHLDPTFAGLHGATHYTYGDEHGVKAGPISDLDSGDLLFFYSTLTSHDSPATVPDDPGLSSEGVDWLASDWGTYLIGGFRIDTIVTKEACGTHVADAHPALVENAHLKRSQMDARVLVVGDGCSRLFSRAVPLSTPAGGTTPNRIVTHLSTDSGEGPWWRRPLRFGPDATAELQDLIAEAPTDWISK